MQAIRWGFLQLREQVQVEVPSLVRLTMNQQAPHTYLFCELNRPEKDVSQEPSAQASPLIASLYPEPREQGDWLGIPASPLLHSLWCIIYRDGGHRPCVVGHHLRRIDWGDHEDFRCPACVCLLGVFTQPPRLLGRSTRKVADQVLLFNRPRRPM